MLPAAVLDHWMIGLATLLPSAVSDLSATAATADTERSRSERSRSERSRNVSPKPMTQRLK